MNHSATTASAPLAAPHHHPPTQQPPTQQQESEARSPLPHRLLSRYEHLPPWVVITQLFFGLGWLRAASEKAIAVDWWTGDTIRAFVTEHRDLTLPWMEPLLSTAVVPWAPLVAVAIVVAQVGVGAALVTNRAATAALVVGCALNLAFLASGAVAPSAFYLIGQGSVLLWHAGRRPSPTDLSRDLRLTTVIAVVLAAISAPFITTLHPAEVIDDPGIMIVTLGGLVALAAQLTHRAAFGRGLL